MRYGQSGNVCGIMLVKVARDNKTVLNTNYVLVEDITENTVPPLLLPPQKEKSLHSNPRDREAAAAFFVRKIDQRERMS